MAPGGSLRDRAATVIWVVPFLVAVAVPGLYRQKLQWVTGFRPVRYLNATLLVALVAAVLVSVLWAVGMRSLRRVLSTASVTVLCLFLWPLVAQLGRALQAAVPWLPIADLVPIAIAIGLIALGNRLGEEPVFPAAIGALGTVILVSLGTSLAVPADPSPGPVAAPVAASGAAKPDVLVVVLDAYGRSDVLRRQYAFDNSAFEDLLGSHGLTVGVDARTTYPFSLASISSMLSLGHHLGEGVVTEEDYALTRQVLSGQNALFAAFADAGYETWFLESQWDALDCGPAVDHCERVRMTAGNAWGLADLTVFRPLLQRWLPNPYGPQALAQLDRLQQLMASTEPGRPPRLVFAHVTLPHPPLNVTSDCDIEIDPLRAGYRIALADYSHEDVALRKVLYTEQIRCLNSRIAAIVEAGVAAHPDITILLTGDHGPDSHGQMDVPPEEWGQEEFDERFNVFLAVRLSKDCGQPVTSSPVNAVRSVVNCALGTSLDPLPDTLLAKLPSAPLALIEVTDPSAALSGLHDVPRSAP